MHHSWAIDPNADRAYRNFETPQKCVRRNPPTAGSFHPQPTKGAKCMFTRIVELTTKPGKNKQLADTIDEKVLPILKKQKGFVDETIRHLLESEPVIRTFNVHSSTSHRIAAGKAA